VAYEITLLSAYHPLTTKQWLGKQIPTTMNTYTTTEELLDAALFMQLMLY
jgi:hypothetical protein